MSDFPVMHRRAILQAVVTGLAARAAPAGSDLGIGRAGRLDQGATVAHA